MFLITCSSVIIFISILPGQSSLNFLKEGTWAKEELINFWCVYLNYCSATNGSKCHYAIIISLRKIITVEALLDSLDRALFKASRYVRFGFMKKVEYFLKDTYFHWSLTKVIIWIFAFWKHSSVRGNWNQTLPKKDLWSCLNRFWSYKTSSPSSQFFPYSNLWI